MRIRDAVERDAEALAELTGIPRDVLVNIVHDRTVRVAERDELVVGFVSFDADIDTVHITRLVGESMHACEILLAEPVRFAEREAMAVELFVLETDGVLTELICASDFVAVETGPRFNSVPSTRYRYDP